MPIYFSLSKSTQIVFPIMLNLSNYLQRVVTKLWLLTLNGRQGVGFTLLCPSSLTVSVTFGVCHAVKGGGCTNSEQESSCILLCSVF